MAIADNINKIRATLPSGISLVTVTKTYPVDTIIEAYDAGERIFGESRPQEMVAKQAVMPSDIMWHQIGSLQTNKVKYIAPFVSLIHSVDSDRLLEVINKEALKNDRIIDVLFEVYIAEESTKHGWGETELKAYLESGALSNLKNIRVRGLMGMATYTDDASQVKREFTHLKTMFDSLRKDYFDGSFDTLSMGMSGDYLLAIECGATMVRVGSSIFGARY
ncbi:MAG: YggS family pyridoxal phosphate-dependent enzyme [Rikenellaceae bacterium]